MQEHEASTSLENKAFAESPGQPPNTIAQLDRQYAFFKNFPATLEAATILRARDAILPGSYAAEIPELLPLAIKELYTALKLHEFDNAVALADFIYANGVTDPVHSFNLACHLHGERQHAAVAAYRRAIRLGCSSSPSNIARLLAGISQYGEAIDSLQRSSDPARWASLTSILCYDRRFDEALSACRDHFEETAKTPADYVQIAIELVTCGYPDEAVAFLESAPSDVAAAPHVAHVLKLYRYLQQRLRRARASRQPVPDNKAILCSVICWGENAARIFTDYVMPSMLTPGNFPSLCTGRRVVLRISTDLVGRMVIAASEPIERLRAYADIEYDIIPRELVSPDPPVNAGEYNYRLFGILVHMALIDAAERGMDAITLVGDTVFSDRYFALFRDLIEQGKEIIAHAAFSARLESVAPILERRIKNGVLEIDPFELIDIGFDHVHPRTLYGFVSPENRWASNHRGYVYFPTSWGLLARRLSNDPVYFANHTIRDQTQFSYTTPDAHLIDRISSSSDDWKRIYTIADNEIAATLELSSSIKNTGEGNVGRTTPRDVANFADNYFHFGYMRHTWHTDFRFRGSKPPPWPGFDPTDFIAKTTSLLFDRV